MNFSHNALPCYLTWEIPRQAGLLLRCFRFPELCPVTVRLPEIFASRRQAAMLIPSALLSQISCDHHPLICSWRQTGSATLVNIKLHFSKKIKCKHFIIVFANDNYTEFSAFFQNIYKYIIRINTIFSVIYCTFRYIFTMFRFIYAKKL